MLLLYGVLVGMDQILMNHGRPPIKYILIPAACIIAGIGFLLMLLCQCGANKERGKAENMDKDAASTRIANNIMLCLSVCTMVIGCVATIYIIN